MRLQRQAELLSEGTFLGVPAKDFERGGREQLSYLLAAGLNPDSKVVDLGCGVRARNLDRDRTHRQSWLEISRRARLH